MGRYSTSWMPSTVAWKSSVRSTQPASGETRVWLPTAPISGSERWGSAFANQSDRIHAQIEENLLGLRSDEFGGVLRPVFQKDEWKLILAGGVIGTIIGALQVVFLFGGF